MSVPVYLVVQMTITEAEAFKRDYVMPLMGQLADHKVKILAADPQPTVIEGSYDQNNTVILKFPSRQALEDWYASEAYAPLKALRAKLSDNAKTTMLVLSAFASQAA